MRVLLVRPPVPRNTIGLKHVMICEPLELEYVAAGIPDHEVAIFDGILERDLEGRIRDFRPDVVGTSSYISGVNEAIKVCRAAKRWSRECRTVIGGVHASLAPEDFLDPAVDCLALGDGTTLMPEILKAFEEALPLHGIPGLALPWEGGMVRTQERPYMPDPDSLPLPRRDLVRHLRHRYYYLFHQPVALMKTTWGCWYRCNFCATWKVTRGTPYSRSPESIVDELANIDCEDVYIVDDIFLINRKRLARIGELMRKRGIRKKFLVYARSDFIAENEDVVAEWSALGLSAVFMGLEAVTNDELHSMRKQNTVEHNRKAIEILRKHRVDTYGSLITQPHYGPEDWDRLKRFIDETKLYYLNVSPLTPLPGTSIWKRYQDRITIPRKAHALWDLSHTVLPTRMPLRRYYRSLLGIYAHACLDPRRAARLSLRTAPRVLSGRFLRLWTGGLKIAWQLLNAHRHHAPGEVALAMDLGPGWIVPRTEVDRRDVLPGHPERDHERIGQGVG